MLKPIFQRIFGPKISDQPCQPVLFLILADDYSLVIWRFAIENDDL